MKKATGKTPCCRTGISLIPLKVTVNISCFIQSKKTIIMPTIGEEIPVSTANEYIEDFIAEYFDTGKAPVKSMIMSASLLRDYLNNADIENVKFMLGARMAEGEEKKVFTLVVAGYDAAGNYVLTPSGNILDHMAPCPNRCPTIGNAAHDIIS